MFEKEAEEYVMREDVVTENDRVPFDNGYGFQTVSFEDEVKKGFKDGAEFGYNKANEWHELKTKRPQLRTKVLWLIDKQLWLGELLESRIDFGEWELDSVLFNDYEIAWKEIVLPELPKESE